MKMNHFYSKPFESLSLVFGHGVDITDVDDALVTLADRLPNLYQTQNLLIL